MELTEEERACLLFALGTATATLYDGCTKPTTKEERERFRKWMRLAKKVGDVQASA